MIIINDFFVVSVDQKYESSVTKSGILTFNTAHQNDEVIERFEKKRIYGRIESIPLQFGNHAIDLIDPGVAHPRKYISSEYIEAKVKMGHKMGREYYSNSTWGNFDVITTSDIAQKCDVRRFDKVYFSESVTEPDNFLGRHKGNDLYKLAVTEIICTVRMGSIRMQGGWCLVEPNVETWEDISIPTPFVVNGKVLTNPDGSTRYRPKDEWIVKKSQPEAKPLEAFMRHFNPFNELNEGDRVIYEYGANWPVTVEGKEYLAIQERDILCKIV